MIRLVIEVDDHPSWAECTKEAVAERLSDLGGVRVVECKVDKPQQTTMTGYGPQALNNVCPHCGARVVMVRGPEGTAVMREVLPKSFWPDPSGPEMVMGIDDTWQRGRLEGDSNVKHTVGFPIHKCGEEAAR